MSPLLSCPLCSCLGFDALMVLEDVSELLG